MPRTFASMEGVDGFRLCTAGVYSIGGAGSIAASMPTGKLTGTGTGAGTMNVNIPDFANDGFDVLLLTALDPGDGSGAQISYTAGAGIIHVSTFTNAGVAADRNFTILHFRIGPAA